MPGSERPNSVGAGDAHREAFILAGTFRSEAHRRELIATVAYARAKRRGFAPGHDVEDWLAAEAQVNPSFLLGVPQE